MSALDERWYWDRRNNKAYYPVETDERTTAFVTVWHNDEVAEARRAGVLVPTDEIGHDRTDTTFDLIDSFRLPTDPSGLLPGK